MITLRQILKNGMSFFGLSAAATAVLGVLWANDGNSALFTLYSSVTCSVLLVLTWTVLAQSVWQACN